MVRAERPALLLPGCLAGVLAFAAPVFAGTARVLAVTDGDTVILQVDGRRQTFDLAGIDAPELTQPHGTQARAALGQRLLGRSPEVRAADGAVTLRVEGVDVAAALVRDGHAWVAVGPRQAELAPLEASARRRRVGLWQGSAAIPPWDWRAGVHSLSSPASRPAGMVVGDRAQERYFPEGCAESVPAERRVLFRSAAAARSAGFRRAPECGGGRGGAR